MHEPTDVAKQPEPRRWRQHVPDELTPAQADGLACVRCGLDFTTATTPQVPAGHSAGGSQVFSCAHDCEVTPRPRLR